jgi:hypothetical protein
MSASDTKFLELTHPCPITKVQFKKNYDPDATHENITNIIIKHKAYSTKTRYKSTGFKGYSRRPIITSTKDSTATSQGINKPISLLQTYG